MTGYDLHFLQQVRMQHQSDQIQTLIHKLIYPPPQAIKKQQKIQYHPDSFQIQSLEVSDYLQLLSHQKKAINYKRWLKLFYINESGILEQQDYKHMFAVACQAHYRRLEHPGYYEKLLEVKETYPPLLFIPLQKDVPRTFAATHPFYQSLRNVLTAYAIRNPSLAYCQGMNYLVAFFLINDVSAEQAFWVVACLVQNCLPDDYFKDLTTISIDVIQELIPQFKLILEQATLESSVLLVPWLVCLFSKGFLTSVSAYLISYLMLQSRQYRAGYILLKISIAILYAVLDRDEKSPFHKDFKTLKEEIEIFVHQISLVQIKHALSSVKLDYATYTKLEDYYKKEKLEARTFMLKNKERKIPLPSCNREYPVCFHRIEIEKKLGAIQNAMILKNGLSIKQQLIDNYLENQDGEETNQISYKRFQQCEVGRQAHICHLSERQSQSKVDVRNHKFPKESSKKIQFIEEQESMECQLQLSTYEERFKEVTEYFEIDENYQTVKLQLEEDLKYEEQLKKQFEEFSIEKPLPIPPQSNEAELNSAVKAKSQVIQSKSLKSFLTQTFQKVKLKISQIQQIKQMKKSTAFIQPNYIEPDNNQQKISQNKDIS